MSVKAIQFIAILSTALALAPGGAHLLELPNKLHIDQQSYITVQQIYRGWALLGIILILAILSNIALAIASRGQQEPMPWAIVAALLLAVTLVVFFLWVFPVNQATSNWSVVPENWHALRWQWEYSHAANAILALLALCAAIFSTLSWIEPRPGYSAPHLGAARRPRKFSIWGPGRLPSSRGRRHLLVFSHFD